MEGGWEIANVPLCQRLQTERAENETSHKSQTGEHTHTSEAVRSVEVAKVVASLVNDTLSASVYWSCKASA